MQTKFNKKIRNRLIFTFLIPLMLVIVIFGILIYFISYRGLENELGRRLISIGLSAQGQLLLEQVVAFQPGDEDTRSYNNIKNKLKKLRDLNKIKKIYIFKSDNSSLVDTDSDVAIG